LEEGYKTGGILDVVTNPFTMMQTNWFRLQDYFQDDEITYLENALDNKLHRVSLMYIPKDPEGEAPLNFHLTAIEKKEVSASLHRENNVQAMKLIQNFLQKQNGH
jgi:hypothetical protein